MQLGRQATPGCGCHPESALFGRSKVSVIGGFIDFAIGSRLGRIDGVPDCHHACFLTSLGELAWKPGSFRDPPGSGAAWIRSEH